MKKKTIFTLLIVSVLLCLVACGGNKEMEYKLTIEVEGEGSVRPAQGTFKENTIITLEILPEEGWLFTDWAGASSSDVLLKNGKWAIYMNDDKKLTAIFERQQYNLNILVEGKGQVEQRLIKNEKSSDYPYEALVELTAVPEEGWEFVQWQRDASGEKAVIRVEMIGDKEIKAIFTESTPVYELKVSLVGEGTVKPDKGTFAEGSKITFQIHPKTDWVFSNWEGENSQDMLLEDGAWSIIIDGAKSLTAVFKPATYSLSIEVVGKGRVEERLLEAKDYPCEAQVELKAIAEEGWQFKEWQGDLEGNAEVVEITLDDHKKIKAVFEPQRYSLKINVLGEGRVEERLINGSSLSSVALN